MRGLGIDGLNSVRKSRSIAAIQPPRCASLPAPWQRQARRGSLDGSPGLRRRPMGRIIEPLRHTGVPMEAPELRPTRAGAARIPLQALEYNLPVASAQVKSCLLLAALAAGGPTILDEPGPSRDHTERMLSNMGVRVRARGYAGDKAPYRTRLEPPADCDPAPGADPARRYFGGGFPHRGCAHHAGIEI